MSKLRTNVALFGLFSFLTLLTATGTVTYAGVPARQSAAWTETVLYNFQGPPDGAIPESSLIADHAGNLFGTTQGGGNTNSSCTYFYGCGVVFELSALHGGTYSESVLHGFLGTPDGNFPKGLVQDSSGNIYGITITGGDGACSCGTLFELSADKGGSYTFTLTHTFSGGTDGYEPYAPLVLGGTSVYGATSAGGPANTGTIFALTSTPTGPSYQQIFAFGNTPDGAEPLALVVDPSGTIFGVTEHGGANNAGRVFALSKSGGSYSENVLYDFRGGPTDLANPISITEDAQGNLFVPAGGFDYGGVAELKPKNGGYEYYVAYNSGSVENSLEQLTLGPDGNFYTGDPLSTFKQSELLGGVLELTLPVEPVPNPPRRYLKSQILVNFNGTSGGAYPRDDALHIDASGAIYGTTQFGGNGPCVIGGYTGCGLVFKLSPAERAVR